MKSLYLTSTTSLSFPTRFARSCSRSKLNFALGNRYEVTMTFSAPASSHCCAFSAVMPPPRCIPSTPLANNKMFQRLCISTHVQIGLTGPCLQSFPSGFIVTRAQLDYMASTKVMLSVQTSKIGRRLPVHVVFSIQ